MARSFPLVLSHVTTRSVPWFARSNVLVLSRYLARIPPFSRGPARRDACAAGILALDPVSRSSRVIDAMCHERNSCTATSEVHWLATQLPHRRQQAVYAAP